MLALIRSLFGAADPWYVLQMKKRAAELAARDPLAWYRNSPHKSYAFSWRIGDASNGALLYEGQLAVYCMPPVPDSYIHSDCGRMHKVFRYDEKNWIIWVYGHRVRKVTYTG